MHCVASQDVTQPLFLETVVAAHNIAEIVSSCNSSTLGLCETAEREKRDLSIFLEKSGRGSLFSIFDGISKETLFAG